jgi:SAM-dependent MidA family methyltransferase
MDACLSDPVHGYYQTRPAIGAGGDFITAPHVSQMFGELLGAWAAQVWSDLGRPSPVRLVELGPGDGTLMSDVLRATKSAPGFAAAVDVLLVETSPPLRTRQARTLSAAAPRWLDRIEDIPDDAPAIILANEFLDCLPIRQAMLCPDGWRERRVGVDASGRLCFTIGDPAPFDLDGGEDGVLEWSAALAGAGFALGALVARARGAALFIDYGKDFPGFGDTLQAVRAHHKEGVLENPGVADLTAHVDFPIFLTMAASAGAQAAPLITQGEFLRRLGVETRAAALAKANPAEAAKIGRQLARLLAPDQMGELFKAACVSSPDVAPPGFA